MKKSSNYRRLLASIDELENIVADDEIVVDTLDEQMPEELDAEDLDVVADGEETEEEMSIEDEIEAAEELVNEANNEEICVSDEEEEIEDDIALAEDMLADDEIEADELELPDDDEEIVNADELEEVLDACDELEQQLDEQMDAEDNEICASEEEPGIEDEIEDTANGGDPTVSELPDTQIDTDTDAEVYPTKSEYVARVTARLDKIASVLEKKGMKKMAFRIDKLSDELENSVR